MKTLEIKTLADAAAIIAVRAAHAYLDAHKLSANPQALAACIQSWIKIKLPEALSDAKAALDCNMHQIAIATFNASLAQAGIEAAKEASVPPQPINA